LGQSSILYIARIRHGKEAELRETLYRSNLPEDLIDKSQLEGIQAFVGSGYFVVEFDYEGEDFTTIWNSFVNLPQVQQLATELQPFLENELNLGQVPSTGDLPLAAFALSWPKNYRKEIVSGSPIMRENPGNTHLPRKEGIPTSEHAGEHAGRG